MTGLAKRNEVGRAVAAGLTALDVMDIENRVFGLAVAVLTLVIVAK